MTDHIGRRQAAAIPVTSLSPRSPANRRHQATTAGATPASPPQSSSRAYGLRIAEPVVASLLGFGSSAIGHLYTPLSDEQAHDALDAAWEAGIRYFDTAPLYGNGLAERRLGQFLADKDRSSYAVSSKVGRIVDGNAGIEESPPHDYSAAGVRRSLERSLERLGIDHLDIALVHDPDDHWDEARREALPELERLRDIGLVRAIGVGMNQVEMLQRFVRESDIDCVLVAGRYSLLDRSAAQLLSSCFERGVTVIVGGVFNAGVLADPERCAYFNYEPASPSVLAAARRLKSVCESYGVPLPAAAIAFALRNPAVTSVLVGARSRAEIQEDMRLLDLEIPDELWQATEMTLASSGAD